MKLTVYQTGVQFMKSLNKVAVFQIAKATRTAEAIFSLLAVRERNKDTTDLRRFKLQLAQEGFEVVPDQFFKTFSELEKVGVGKIMKTPGQPTRFRWHYALKEVGRAAFEPVPMVLPTQVEPPKPAPVSPPTQLSRGIVICLDNSRQVELVIPANLTQSELTMICNILLKTAK